MSPFLKAFFCIAVFSGPSLLEASVFKSNKSHEELLRCYISRGIEFEPQRGDFSLQNAHSLALLSMAAYLDAPQAVEMAHLMGFKTAELLEAASINWGDYDLYSDTTEDPENERLRLSLLETESAQDREFRIESTRKVISHTFLLFAARDDMAIMAYRGTDLSRDYYSNIMTNLSVRKEKFGNDGEIHSGFYGATKIIWNELTRMLNSMASPVPVLFTGQSLGGALSTVSVASLFKNYTLHLKRQNEKKNLEWTGPYAQALYTYGSPRVGNQKFVDSFAHYMQEIKQSSLQTGPLPNHPEGFTLRPRPYSARFVNNHDVVARIPDPLSYRHIDQPKYFDEEGNFFEDHQAQKKLWWSNILFNLFDGTWDEVEDHNILNYVERTYELLHWGAPSLCL